MRNLTNLLQETIEELKRYGLKEEDVRWVGTRNGKYAISWEEFKKIAKKFNYDAGFGAWYVPLDLVVVGDDWWLERQEYDGAEWWEYRTTPKKQPDAKPFKRLDNLSD